MFNVECLENALEFRSSFIFSIVAKIFKFELSFFAGSKVCIACCSPTSAGAREINGTRVNSRFLHARHRLFFSNASSAVFSNDAMTKF
jgi:hypothetical protein